MRAQFTGGLQTTAVAVTVSEVGPSRSSPNDSPTTIVTPFAGLATSERIGTLPIQRRTSLAAGLFSSVTQISAGVVSVVPAGALAV